MSPPKHSPPGDDSFRRSLLRNGGSALGLVVLIAVIFWGIGSVGGDQTPTAADGSTADEPATDGSADTDDGAAEEPTDAAPTETDAPDEVDPAPEEPEEPQEPEEPGETEASEEPEAPSEEPEEPESPEEPDEPVVAPGDVTVQVLDGVKDDGGTAADGVASVLTDAGYQIIARNDALSYDVTTVLYNVGNEAAARQVADDLGGAEVREQPGNLSTQVDLHVVVGRDRA